MLTQIWCNDFQLADGVTNLAAPMRMPATNAVQKVIPLRSLGVVNFNRITKSYVVEFSITRLHATTVDAFTARANHNNLIPNVADLTMEWSDSSGTVTAIITGAAWETVDVQLIGEISTRATYRVSGGPMTVTATNTSDPAQTLNTESGVALESESGTEISP